MTQDELFKLHDQITMMGLALMKRKNADYGANEDPFANFRMSALLHVPPAIGVLLRLQDKMARLISFVEKGKLEVTEESWMDACIDIVNYTVILAGLLTEMKGKEPDPIDAAINIVKLHESAFGTGRRS